MPALQIRDERCSRCVVTGSALSVAPRAACWQFAARASFCYSFVPAVRPQRVWLGVRVEFGPGFRVALSYPVVWKPWCALSSSSASACVCGSLHDTVCFRDLQPSRALSRAGWCGRSSEGSGPQRSRRRRQPPRASRMRSQLIRLQLPTPCTTSLPRQKF